MYSSSEHEGLAKKKKKTKKKSEHKCLDVTGRKKKKKATAAIKLISFSNIYKTFSKRIMRQADQSL